MTPSNRSFEVVVVGGGVIGLSVALELRRRGKSVALMERQAFAKGASACSIGALMPHSPTVVKQLKQFQLDSLLSFPEFIERIERASGRSTAYRRMGRIEFISDDKHRQKVERQVEKAREIWPRFDGEDGISLIDYREADRLNPGIAPSVHGYLRCRLTAQVDVDALLVSLHCAAENLGVTLYPQTEVTAINGLDGTLQTSQGAFSAGEIVMATGAWSNAITCKGFTLPRIDPVKGQALFVRPPRDLPVNALLKNGKTYLLQRADGLITIGSTTELDAGFDTEPTVRGMAGLLAGARAVLPNIEQAHFVRVWAGLRPVCFDRFPLIGRLREAPRILLATAHYKIGIGLAPITARVIGDLVCKGATEVNYTDFEPNRFASAG